MRKLITLSSIFLWPTGRRKGLVTLVKNFTDYFAERSWILNMILIKQFFLAGMLEHKALLSRKLSDDFKWITVTRKGAERDWKIWNLLHHLSTAACKPQADMVCTPSCCKANAKLFAKVFGWRGGGGRARPRAEAAAAARSAADGNGLRGGQQKHARDW